MSKVSSLKGKDSECVEFIYCNCQTNWVADESLSGPKNAANRRKYIEQHADHDLVAYRKWTWRKYQTNNQNKTEVK